MLPIVAENSPAARPSCRWSCVLKWIGANVGQTGLDVCVTCMRAASKKVSGAARKDTILPLAIPRSCTNCLGVYQPIAKTAQPVHHSAVYHTQYSHKDTGLLCFRRSKSRMRRTIYFTAAVCHTQSDYSWDRTQPTRPLNCLARALQATSSLQSPPRSSSKYVGLIRPNTLKLDLPYFTPPYSPFISG